MLSGFRAPLVIIPLAAYTTAGDSGGSYLALGAGRASNVVKLVITAISGAAATLNLFVDHSDTGTGGWVAIDTFPAQTATTPGITRSGYVIVKAFTRVSYTITGTTPSVTFSVTTAITEPIMLAG